MDKMVLVTSAPPAGILLRSDLLKRVLTYLPAMVFGHPFSGRPDHLQFLMLNGCFECGELDVEAFLWGLQAESGRAARAIVFWLPSAWVRAKATTCPVLILAGSEDRFTPLSMQMAIARRYRHTNVTMKIIHSGHMPMLEVGKEANAAAVIDWLGRHR